MSLRFFQWALGCVFVIVIAGILYLGRGPDFEVTFERQIPSPYSAEKLSAWIENLEFWPEWHHQITAIRLESGKSPHPQALLRATAQPKAWRTYEMEIRVLEWQSSKRYSFELLKQTSGKLEHLLRNLKWNIELTPMTPAEGQGTWIKGSAHAWTHSRRGRFFARLSSRILMNQVYYPDLASLGLLAKQVQRNTFFDPPQEPRF